MSQVAIKVENLSKLYRLGEVGSGSISEDLNRWWARLRGKEDPLTKVGSVNDRTQKAEKGEHVWAIKDINFEVGQGEVLGIIGRNGAGKSTLLKLLSKITAPTTGSIKARGRIASLLEVGTGMNPEMTGIENIYLNGTILGMTKREISAKLDDILDFAGCAKYGDTPVKRYSSGMKVRLGFAVAAFLEPEILIVDEVLAVGDAEFQKRAIGKMQEVSRVGGRTVLFVSHNMSSILKLCPRSILLENGTVIKKGKSFDVISFYQNEISENKQSAWIQEEELNHLHTSRVQLKISGKQPDLKLIVHLTVKSVTKHLPAHVAFDIKNSQGLTIMQAIPSQESFIFYAQEEQEYITEIELFGLIPDTYYLSVWLGPHNTETFDWQKDIVSFEVIESPLGRAFPHTPDHGFVVPFSTVNKALSKTTS